MSVQLAEHTREQIKEFAPHSVVVTTGSPRHIASSTVHPYPSDSVGRQSIREPDSIPRYSFTGTFR